MWDAWVEEELQTVDLGDKRLDARLGEVLSQLGGRPTASIPAACGGHAEMTAAYRLFDNPKARFENVLLPHVDATRRRVAAEPAVLLTQDTTELDLTRPEQPVVGTGPLDGGARRGVFLHVLQAFTPDGTPLGTLAAKLWAREEGPLPPKAERAAKRKRTPIEEKESLRWIETMRQVREEARRAPQTHLVGLADSEGDIYELLVEAQAEPHEFDWIVRACQDRALEPGPEADGAGTLRVALLREPVLFTHTITVRARKAKVGCEDRGRRQARERRTAELNVRAARVTLRPPRRPDRPLPPVSVNAVLVREIAPPAGEEPVEWLLLTSLPLDTVEQVGQAIRYYCGRWMIEVSFRTLKSGCRVEARRFERVERLEPCLALFLIVAWRTLYVCRLGRGCPDLSCEVLFEPEEWKAVYQVVCREPPPSTPPALGKMVQMVAQLGGYVKRKESEPGPQTVWLGLQRMHDLALCWQLFGPGGKDV